MNRAELHDVLVQLGTQPVPLPDHDRLDALEVRLLREFAVAAPAVTPVATIESARRRRRQVLVAGLSAAAAALATAMVLARGGETTYEVSAATGAVAMYPDGASRPVQAGDHVPAGGVIRTGPTGGVTIEETTVGADHVIVLDEEKITLLPAPPAAQPADAQPAAPVATAPATAPPTAAPVTLVPTIATPAPPAPAAASPAPLSLSVAETRDGAQLSWTPTDAAAFASYIVVRGMAGTDLLEDIVVLPNRQATTFTDVSAPTGVELCYRIVAVGADGLPVAESETITFVREGTGGSNEIPPSTGSAPPTTPAESTTTPAPPTTAASHRPATTVAATTIAETTVPARAPDNGAPGTDDGWWPLDDYRDQDHDSGDGNDGDDGWWRDGGTEDWDQDDWG